MPARTIALAAVIAVSTISTGAFPGPGDRPAKSARMSLEPSALRFGRSIGSPDGGRLIGGAHLDETAYLRIMPADAAGDVRWGLEPLVEMIDRAARSVRRRFAGAVTCVGHLSREGGGDVRRHRSHESGRDADIGFFVRSSNGQQLFAPHFVPFRADGTAVGWPGAYFDDAKNWALASDIATDPQAHVTHVFISWPLRARLLAFAERTGVDAGVRARVAEVMRQPRDALPHDDHFHVRIGCPARMNGCVENPVRAGSPAIAGRQRRRAAPGPSRKAGPVAPISGVVPAARRRGRFRPSRRSPAEPGGVDG